MIFNRVGVSSFAFISCVVRLHGKGFSYRDRWYMRIISSAVEESGQAYRICWVASVCCTQSIDEAAGKMGTSAVVDIAGAEVTVVEARRMWKRTEWRWGLYRSILNDDPDDSWGKTSV